MNRKELIEVLQREGQDEYGGILSEHIRKERDKFLEDVSQNEPDIEERFMLSFSKIRMVLRCGLQYYYRYIRNIVLPPRAAMTVGKTVGETIDYSFDTKRRGHRLNKSMVKDYFHSRFEKEACFTDFSDEPKDSAEKRGESLVLAYFKNKYPYVEPKEVQKEYRINLAEYGVYFLGYCDLIDQQDNIIDHKCSNSRISSIKGDNFLQLSIYSLLFRTYENKQERSVGIHNLVSTKRDGVVIQELQTEIGIPDIIRVRKIIEFVAKVIRNRMFLPAAPDHWCCSPDWCGYWQICHEEI